MIIFGNFRIWWFLFVIGRIAGTPYNQPKFCANASWNTSAINFATNTLVGVNPWAVFVNTNNTVYVANRERGLIVLWLEGSIVPTKNISGNLSIPYSLFVADTSDIYVDNGEANFQVDKWSLNSTSSVAAMYMCGGCYGLFIDINNSLYCSMYVRHQVISQSLNSRLNVWSVVAGTGVSGVTSMTISYPRGVIVDRNLNLYVADYNNDRIQRYLFGQLNGTTIVGAAAPGTISLIGPTALVFDADGYLFISDTWNHRIVGSGPNGFRCIVACSGAGSSSSSLYFPASLSFDTYGNFYVADWGNNRIQKFILTSNSCGGTTATTAVAMTTSGATIPLTTASMPVSSSNVVSYNQPKFSALASWSGSAITFATSPTVGGTPYGLFVDINNTVYVADRANSRVQVWLEGSSAPTRTITNGLAYPYSVFATGNGDIYVDNGYSFNRVDRWMLNRTNSSSVMYVKDVCYGLFIDLNNNLYCSIYNKHQIGTTSLNGNSSIWIVAAGTDCSGSTSNTLLNPRGIFVDTDLSLYVADCGNNRVQKYLSQQLNAITVAGSKATGTITLNCPSGVVLDGNGYIFIVDSNNHRIVASGPNGFRCIVGCSTVAGSLSSQLNNPSDVKFDSYGNIFVTDRDNNRIQKFILIPNTTYPLSINQPKFCPSTTWYADAVTFANSSMVGVEPYGLFVDTHNTIYGANRQFSLIQIWFEGNVNPNRSLSGGLSYPYSLFVTLSGDMYVDNGISNARVDKWSISTNSSIPVMTISANCYSIFVDISNTLYCAMTFNHRVAKKWLVDNGTTPTIVAGSGSTGAGADMLYYPVGLFVDLTFNLYVGDCGHDRIQMFPLGQMNAITVAGNGAPGTFTLNCPNAIAFDANGYLFIGDNYNSRIIGSGPYGFRCLFGCGGSAGAGSQQLNYPRQFSFDTYGNFYVTDQYNYRIQKFILASNSCSLSYNQPKFCPDAVWFANASTVASSAALGLLPFGIFVDGINNIYAPSPASNAILVWSPLGTLLRSTTSNFNRSFSVFVSINGDIYIDNGLVNRRVDKSLFNTSTMVTVMNVNGSCYGLFIDLNNYLYCSLKDFHQVVKVLLNSGTTIPTMAAGTGSPGSASNMLNAQQGIYVDNYFNLYIADCGNNRIQLYQSGQVNGMTVAGSSASGTISLNCPTGVVLDFDGYLFIVDSNNHRIVGSSSLYGFRCLVGCSGGGSTSSQLSFPQSMAFDSNGNIYVTDRNNSRIQNFNLQKTNCSTPTTIQTTIISTTNAAQTTVAVTTSAAQTTVAATASAVRTTAAGTTIVATTSAAQTTVAATTSAAQTTAAGTTFAATTSAAQTTVAATTSAAQTTAAGTTNATQTSAAMTASAAQTTAAVTTSAAQTTAAVTTSTAQTTTTVTISTAQTTAAAITSAVQTTVTATASAAAQTSAAVTTSAAQTAATATTSAIQTTTAATTSVAQTTTAETTSAAQTTIAETTSAAQTTIAETTSAAQTTTAETTSVAQTTTAETTSAVQTTTAETTSVAQTTTAETTSAAQTTTAEPTSVAQTTTAETTSAAQTTIAETTSVAQTTTAETTSAAQTTIAETTSVAQTTIAETTSVAQTTTAETTSAAQTTTAETTSVAQTTTAEPTSVAQTTTAETTSAAQTTIAETTSAAQTTTAEPTSVAQTTTAETTSAAQTTIAETTSAAQTTTAEPTSVAQTTTAETTSTAQTTIAETTSVAQTTTAETTSAAQTTTAETTSVAQTTTAEPTSVAQTTTAETTSAAQTTIAETTSAAQTTTAEPTSVAQTTTAETTSTAQTTIAETTSVAQTTTAETTSAAQTTTAETTSVAQTTTAEPTSVAQTTTAETTSTAQTTIAETTSVAQTTTAETTSAAQTTTAETTSVAQTTTAEPTSVAQTTTAETTSAAQTTIAETTSAAQTTMPPTTSLMTTMVTSTTSPFQTTIAEGTTQLQKDESTSVEQLSMTLTNTMSMTTTQDLNRTCYSPVITLIPGQSTLISLLSYRRSQDFSISSMIQLNCDVSLSTITKWTIKNCTSTICSFAMVLNQKVITTFSELYIPSRTLAYGTYELTLTVTMTDTPTLKSSSSVYVRITATGVTANLVQLGTSMITRGSQQDLLLDPGTFSVDPDEDFFDASKWKYEYYCRLYGLYNYPNIHGILLSISDSRIDPNNPSCLSNQSVNGTILIYGNSSVSPKSSLIIRGGSLRPNQVYQFMAYLENRKNSSIQATGYVLVTIEVTRPQLIAIGCVISVMCVPNLEFQLVNPTTQVALFAMCIGSCLNIESIRWNIYQGSDNSSSNSTQWILLNQIISYENIWFFGSQTTNFTATNQLFLNNPQINLWRFEVVYTFPSETSTSALNFVMNKAPYNGSCIINPSNGTTTTLFTVSCPDWFDEDGIKDYSLYAWTTNVLERVTVAFSMVSTFTVRLPAGDKEQSLLHMVINIRDLYDCVREVNMSSMIVSVDSQGINNLINSFQTSTIQLNKNPFVQLLFSGNQNVVGQVLTSVSQEFNQINTQSIDTAVSSGISAASISISSLGSQSSSQPSIPFNESALIEYTKDLNSQANVRDYLMNFVTNLPITTVNSIKLQSSSLVQLTAATNQLTRTAATLAAEKSYQLALTLYSLARKVAFEDVQVASKQLTQCATNVLTAINGPLQDRTIVLDLDLSRANTAPIDYDSDLESPWSNTNSLSDGNGLSIEASRNLYYQKQSADVINSRVTEIHSLITSSLNIHLNLGQNFVINTSQTFVTLETISIESLGNKLIQQPGNTQFQIPANFTLNITSNSSIALRSSMEPLASMGSSKVQSNTNLSTSISLSMLDQNGNEISFQTNSMRLIIPRDPNVIIPSMNRQNVTLINSTTHNFLFYFHYINISSSLPISVHIEMHPLNITLAYLLIYKFDQTPQLNSSLNSIDGWILFCPFNLSNENMYLYFLDNQQTLNHQSLIFGLRELNSQEIDQYCSNNSFPNNPPITDQTFHFTSDYELRIYTSGCYYFDVNNHNYQSDGLLVGSLTNHYQTECFSSHLTTFAGGFIVLPAPINWSYVFANLDFMKNKTVYLTVILISVFYLILTIYARFHDKADLQKLGVTSLSDNQRGDQYFYQILIFTGQRVNAGTQSKISFILSGDQNETAVRRLEDPHRKICQRGGIDVFILAVPKSLGLLNYIRIWHDNSGKGSSASWFLKYVIVRDLQTMEKFYFIAQRWFAVEKEDGLIERVLPIANEIEIHEFSYLLSKKTYHSVSDGHLWFSIFSRPPSTRFTRVQRCTCCFVLLFSSMLLNIMYYQLAADAKSSKKTDSNSLSIGPFYISPQQIGIGVMVELFSLVPSLLIVQFFRRIRTRNQISPLRQALTKINPSTQIVANKVTEKKKKSRSPLTFPWWCLFVVYILSFLIILISIFFIIVRGIELGDFKTQQWLTSILTGIFSSIFLTQPIKIVCLAIFFACFCRNSTDAKEENEYIDDDRIDIDDDDNDDVQNVEKISLYIPQSSSSVNRLNEGELVYAREQRLKEMQMWSIIQEFFIHFIFFILICLITFSSPQQNSSDQVQHLRSYFLNTRQIDYDYTKIATIGQYWQWLEGSFVGNIRAQQWYNGENPRNLNGYINDKSNRLIGWATMRQLRVKSKLCSDQRIISFCEQDYSLFNEEKRSFTPGWTNETTDEYSSSIKKAFQYQLSENLDTYVYIGQHGIYSGNGYVYEFRGSLSNLKSNLSILHQLGWIDMKTGAILIQITLYNPNAQLFTSVALLNEFLSTGGVVPSARFEPLDFYVFTSLLQLICTIIYMCLIIYFMFKEIQLFIQLKRKYFRQFWSLINLGIIGCSWGSMAAYIWRFRESNRLSQIFQQTNGYTYINLQQAVYVNDLLTCLQGFCCFFGMIKFIHLCRINPRLTLFIQTLSYAAKELIAFLMMFSIIFMSFICLFYLLFVSKIWSCADLLGTAQMLFEVTLMKFDTSQLLSADAVLGPVCFTMFIFIVVFVCLSMFLSIINQSFRHAREQPREEGEMVRFILNKFLRWTGLKKPSATEMQEERDSRMRSRYFDPIENFPDRIDQLLQVLSRIYVDQKAELARLQKYET